MAPLRFISMAVGICLLAVPAFAQNSPDITVKLTPAQIAEVMRLVDQQPLSKATPAAYWDLQLTIREALRANPDASRAVFSAGSARR